LDYDIFTYVFLFDTVSNQSEWPLQNDIHVGIKQNQPFSQQLDFRDFILIHFRIKIKSYRFFYIFSREAPILKRSAKTASCL